METAKLNEIAKLFLKLGTTAFGGPAAHIAMMEEEVVRRRKWLSQEEFLDLISATHLIPGPNSTEMAIHIGHKMGGWKGLLLAGTLFIAPAFLIVWAAAWFYVQFGSLPSFQNVFLGIKPVILAVIAQAIWSLSQKAVKDRLLAVLAVLSLGLYLLWGNELVILAFIALANLALRGKRNASINAFIAFIAPTAFSLLSAATAWAQNFSDQQKVPIEKVFFFFIKVGSVLFGSGYVLIAFLQSDLVEKYQWLSQQQLLDAIAIGQFTPGPVFTTATFIGYILAGHMGAISATLGIFLPAFFFVAISAPLVAKMRKSKWASPILDGLNVSSLSLMVGAGLILAKDSMTSGYALLAFALSLGLLVKFKTNSAWLVLAGGICGFLGLT